jgi:virginiamycin B lyase
MNSRPHGLGCASDGALWFTGKLSNTVGRVYAGQVQHFQLPTIGAVPIYLGAGTDGSMWCTELTGNMIAFITREGKVTEYKIPTGNSRPIAIVPAPDGESMWFTEEAGCKVARIDTDGTITEFAVPATDHGSILGALAFDKDGALWVQQYVNPPAAPAPGIDPYPPTASDYIVRMGAELLTAPAGDLSGVPISYFKAPSKGTVMHRIIQGPDGNIWFTELGLNQVGRVSLEHC